MCIRDRYWQLQYCWWQETIKQCFWQHAVRTAKVASYWVPRTGNVATVAVQRGGGGGHQIKSVELAWSAVRRCSYSKLNLRSILEFLSFIWLTQWSRFAVIGSNEKSRKKSPVKCRCASKTQLQLQQSTFRRFTAVNIYRMIHDHVYRPVYTQQLSSTYRYRLIDESKCHWPLIRIVYTN